MSLIIDYNFAKLSLYNHVGFVEDWVVCPIDDCTNYYWGVDEDCCIYAETIEQFKSEGDYYKDDIYKQCHYSKWVYEGKDFTMVMCNPNVDGVRWFRFFDNKKRLPLKTAKTT